MAEPDAADAPDTEAVRIYLAAKLGEAQSIEAELDRHGIEYDVAVEPYIKATLLGLREYKGAAFYVISSDAARAKAILSAAGFTVGLQEQE